MSHHMHVPHEAFHGGHTFLLAYFFAELPFARLFLWGFVLCLLMG